MEGGEGISGAQGVVSGNNVSTNCNAGVFCLTCKSEAADFCYTCVDGYTTVDVFPGKCFKL